MSKKRIIEEQATTDIFNDDWLVKDSVTQGTTKIQPSVFKAWINDGMATEEDIETIVENIADTYSASESYAEGDLCIHEYALFKCIGATTGTWDSTKWQATTIAEIISTIDLSAEAISYDNTSSGLEAENVQDAIDAVETALETKAEKNGVYDDLVAGNLLSDSYTADNAPYLYRQSPSASSVEQNIVGGSVAWNQLVQNGDFADGASGWSEFQLSASVSNNVATCTVSSAGNGSLIKTFSVNQNHIYLVNTQVKGTDGNTVRLRGDGSMSITTQETTATTFTQLETVGKASSTGNYRFIVTGVNANSVFNTKNCNCIDLTQAFGTTIADYIYSLEQATAGSGISWLKANGFLTKNYYPYDRGSLQSVKTSGRKIVGKNLWSLGNISGTKQVDVDVNIPIGSWTFSCEITSADVDGTTSLIIFYYDDDTTFLTRLNRNTRVSYTFTATKHIKKISFYAGYNSSQSAGDTFTFANIQLESGSTATAYEPYNQTTYPLSNIDLRGIVKKDASNNLYYDGDVYESDGSVKRKYGIVDLSSLTWSHASPNRSISNAIANTIKKPATQTSLANLLTSNIYTQVPSNTSLNTNGQFAISQSGDMIFYYDGVNEPKGYMVYELATPTTESADAYENPQLVGSTEEFIDTRDVPMPVGGEKKYHEDLKAKLEELAKIPDVPSTNGTYTLKATRSASGVTYAWVSG